MAQNLAALFGAESEEAIAGSYAIADVCHLIRGALLKKR